MIVARAYRLALSLVLAWPAVDVLVAAWSVARHDTSTHYARHELELYGANLTAYSFHDPKMLREAATNLRAHEPTWEKKDAVKPSGDWDGFAAMAATMGVG